MNISNANSAAQAAATNIFVPAATIAAMQAVETATTSTIAANVTKPPNFAEAPMVAADAMIAAATAVQAIHINAWSAI